MLKCELVELKMRCPSVHYLNDLCDPHRPRSSSEVLAATGNPSGFSVFDALRDTIYSEVATLIANNEARPHFLVSKSPLMQ